MYNGMIQGSVSNLIASALKSHEHVQGPFDCCIPFVENTYVLQ